MSTTDEKPLLIYLHFSDASSLGDEGELELADGSKAQVIWKDVLVEGEYPLTPGASGPIKRKLTVVAEGNSSREDNIVAMSDLIDAHEDSAFKYVTIPVTHKDGVLDNTGYVPRPKGLRVTEKTVEGEQKKVMQAALGFTEPDVKGKVQRGTIPDCSAGIFFDWLNKHKNKRYRSAMKHVALTPTPFMGNLDPFPAVFASDPDIEGEVQVQHFMFDDGTEANTDDANKGDIVWHEKLAMRNTLNQIDVALNPKPLAVEGESELPVAPRPFYMTHDISHDDNALVEEIFKGQQRRWVIPYTRDSEGVVALAPATRWVEVREAMIAASDDDFDTITVNALQTRLSSELVKVFGLDSDKFEIDDISLDQRVRISNTETGSKYLAKFAVLTDKSVFIEPSHSWERVKAPEQRMQPAPAPENVTLSDGCTFDMSTARGRVEAARQQRRLRSSF